MSWFALTYFLVVVLLLVAAAVCSDRRSFARESTPRVTGTAFEQWLVKTTIGEKSYLSWVISSVEFVPSCELVSNRVDGQCVFEAAAAASVGEGRIRMTSTVEYWRGLDRFQWDFWHEAAHILLWLRCGYCTQKEWLVDLCLGWEEYCRDYAGFEEGQLRAFSATLPWVVTRR